MPELAGTLSVVLAFFVVAASPGPANIAVATVAMSAGRRSGILVGLGLSVGLAFWGVIAATGLGALLQTSAELLSILKVVGGSYLLWLGYQSGRSALALTATRQATVSHGGLFKRGLLLNLSNPKAVVAWMAVLSMGSTADGSGKELTVITLVCMALGLFNYMFHALVFSYPGAMAAYTRFRRWFEGAAACLFAAAGFGLIRSALSR